MASLRERLSTKKILVAPGAYDALTARLVEAAGFEAVYMSGAGVSFSLLAQPDVGLVTQTEMADRVGQMARAISVPLICDGDNGHGNALNLMRTVRLFEERGASAIQLEDQSFPKRCGHLAGKKLVSEVEMVGKIRAACAARRSRDFLIIGRTDSRSVLGLDEALKRARAYREAGADVLFVEAPETREEMREIAKALPGIPLMANMVEGGKTPLVSRPELEELGFALVIYPNSLTRRFVRVAEELLGELKERGTTAHLVPEMTSFTALNELLGIASLGELEKRFLPNE